VAQQTTTTNAFPTKPRVDAIGTGDLTVFGKQKIRCRALCTTRRTDRARSIHGRARYEKLSTACTGSRIIERDY
jgi:hypothetical protein